MQTLGNARDHFWRVIKMAKANNVDLSDALDRGQINVEEYGEMITACRGCSAVGQCDKLLRDLPDLGAAPDYCVNAPAFAALRRS